MAPVYLDVQYCRETQPGFLLTYISDGKQSYWWVAVAQKTTEKHPHRKETCGKEWSNLWWEGGSGIRRES